MNLGKELANIFNTIGKSLSIAPSYKEKYKYKPKSDRESLKEDWDNVGSIFDEVFYGQKDEWYSKMEV